MRLSVLSNRYVVVDETNKSSCLVGARQIIHIHLKHTCLGGGEKLNKPRVENGPSQAGRGRGRAGG